MAKANKTEKVASSSVDKTLASLRSSLNKEFKSELQTEEEAENEGVVSFASGVIGSVEFIPTDIVALDYVMGRGLPRGRVTTIFGPEASGKTTLALQMIAAIQKRGGICAFIDVEQAYNAEWAEQVGVDNGALLLTQPDNGEQALQIVDRLVESNKVDLIVVDSVAALVPQSEIDKEVGENSVAVLARLLNDFFRKTLRKIKASKTSVVLINQIRQKVGVMFGNPETMPGGEAIKFYSSIIMRAQRDKKKTLCDKLSGDPIGHVMIAKNTKNKCAPPYRATEYMLIYGKGVDNREALIDEMIRKGSIIKPPSGPTYTFRCDPSAKVSGRNNICAYLTENPAIAEASMKDAGVDNQYIDSFKNIIDTGDAEVKEKELE